MSRGTRQRSVRVEDELWTAAKDVADENDDNLSDIIRAALKDYIAANKGAGTIMDHLKTIAAARRAAANLLATKLTPAQQQSVVDIMNAMQDLNTLYWDNVSTIGGEVTITPAALDAAAYEISAVDYPNYEPDLNRARTVLEAARPHLKAQKPFPNIEFAARALQANTNDSPANSKDWDDMTWEEREPWRDRALMVIKASADWDGEAC